MRRWLHRLQILALVIVIAVAVYSAVAYWVVPGVAATQLEQRLSEALHQPVDVGRVTLDPFRFVGEVHEVAIGVGSDDPMARIERVRFNFDPFNSLARRAWSFGLVRILGPHAKVVVQSDGQTNWHPPSSSGPPQEGPPPPVVVEVFEMQGGSVAFADHSQPEPVTRTLDRMELHVQDFATRGAPASFALSVQSEAGERVRSTGRLGMDPLQADGRVSVQGVQLAFLQPYLHALLDARIASGIASLELNYMWQAEPGRVGRVQDVEAIVRDLALVLPEQLQPVVQVSQATVRVSEANWFDREVVVQSVNVQEPTLRLERAEDGSLNVTRLLAARVTDEPGQRAAAAAADPAAGEASPAKPFGFRLHEAHLSDGVVEWADRTLPTAELVRLADVTARVEVAGGEIGQGLTVTASAAVAGSKGLVQTTGQVHVEPLESTLVVQGEEVPLVIAAPYLQQVARLTVTDGTVGWSGTLRLQTGSEASPQLGWEGELHLADVRVIEPESEARVAEWQRLTLEDLQAAWPERELRIRAVQWLQPRIRVAIDEQGDLNLAQVIPAGSGEEAAPDAAKNEAPLRWQVAELTLEGGEVQFVDRSAEHTMDVTVTAVNGLARNLSSDPAERAEVGLAASIGGLAPVAIRGLVNTGAADPFEGLDLSVDLANLPMEALEPYVQRYLGYTVRAGELRGDFAYDIRDGQLTGANHVVLDQFFLGEQTDENPMINAPVQLGLAALRDGDDRIELQVPVSGSLKSPEFNLGQVIGEAVGNTFQRIATAPFRALGNLLGLSSGDDDPGQVQFAAGSAELSPEARRRLETVAKILQARPGLSLEIQWAPDPALDTAALQQQRLAALLQERAQQLVKEGDDVTEEEALRAVYVERFPEAAPALAARVQAQPAAERSWLGRAFDALFRGTPRGRAAQVATPAANEAVAGPTPQQMRERLLATLSPDESALGALARRRAELAAEALVQSGVAPERVAVADAAGVPRDAAPPQDHGRVYLALQAAEQTQSVTALTE